MYTDYNTETLCGKVFEKSEWLIKLHFGLKSEYTPSLFLSIKRITRETFLFRLQAINL
jgi:hypothetical protein